jgi:hypothetical protein
LEEIRQEFGSSLQDFMNKKTKIIADQLARGLNYFEELNIPFVMVMEGIPQMFGPNSDIYKAAILERQHMLNCKIAELEVENQAEKITIIPKTED